MAPRRVGRPCTSLVLLLVLHLLSAVSSTAHTHPTPTTTVQVIKSLCDAAPFPDLCRKSTSHVSLASAHDPHTVARTVLYQCLTSAKTAGEQVNGVSADMGTSPARSCVKSVADSVDVLAQAVEELGFQLGAPGSPGYGARLGIVQAKANTAISNLEDCASALQEVPGIEFLDVGDTVMQAMQMTSNALVFMDALAPKHA